MSTVTNQEPALPRSLEEMKEILAKNRSQVDEELWRNAIKVVMLCVFVFLSAYLLIYLSFFLSLWL